MANHVTIGVYDYDREKLCDLYDSQNDLIGQAFDIAITEDFDGMHTLEFKIPYTTNNTATGESHDGAAKFDSGRYGKSKFGILSMDANRNFRWEFLKSDYLIRYTFGEKKIWFVASKPQKNKSGKKIYGLVKCAGFESLLKTRNIYMEFDDENGIGTIDYIIRQILQGTGWTYNENSDTILEKDGITEKIRSLQNSSKKGALDLITTTCNLFQARPIYDTDAMTVTIKAINNRQQVLEAEVGKNLNAISVQHDSSNIATRINVEGEYTDDGYVGIDDVEVDGETYGLPFIVNFDYYREIGVFKESHEAALATYMTDIRAKKAEIRAKGAEVIACEDEINTLIGQCKMALYFKDYGVQTPAYTYGDITSEQAMLQPNDDVVVLQNDHTHIYTKWIDPDTLMADAYGVVKFVTKASGKIGAAEVQIEAKQKEIAQLVRKIDTLPETSIKKVDYNNEINRLNSEIATLYAGTSETDGLYEMMYDVMATDGLFYDLDVLNRQLDVLNAEQDEIEATFAHAMGYMLRDGGWSNTNYVVGQEESLYLDAVDMAREMSRPTTNYSFEYVRVAEDFDISAEDIQINAVFKLYDPELEIDDRMFVKSITYGVDNKKLGSIEVSNQDITLTGNDLGSLLSRMSQIADLIEQKNAMYERAKALSDNGTLYADRLNGQIDVLKTKIQSTTSNWYTDEQGNIVFLSADGNSAMMLSGAGFMIASAKDENGDWDWRAFGDGKGFTADEITAGFISAERIEAGSITTSHLASDVGSTLNLTSNEGLVAYVESAANKAASEVQLTDKQFSIMFNRTVKDDIDNSINEVQNNLTQYTEQVSNYMRYDDTGTLTLGDTESSFKTQITNEKLSFMQDSTEVAYISNQNMFITNANATERLTVGAGPGRGGYFDWVVTPTGLGLRYRGS